MEDEIRRVNPDAEILGWKTPEQIQSYLRTRRALVFTSLWYEGQPLVIDEAAALGLPVICSDVSAGARAVRSRNAGELYSAQSIDELATVMNKFDDDEIVRYHSDSSFHAYWSNPQTMERHIRELLAIYSEVLAD
jgi:glycosyltransferase involved in cell wall biosynthesis